MERKGWLTWRKLVGIVFLLFLIDVSCFGAWWAISHPPEKLVLPEGVRIGLSIDTTHYSGRHILMGAQMAADEINEYGTGGPLDPGEGGVLVGKERLPVFIVKEESQEMSPDVGTERTVAAVTKLLTTHKVNVVMGGYATPLAALEICARYKTIYICTGSSANSITDTVIANYEKYKYIFNTGCNSTSLGRIVTEFYAWLKDTYGFTKVAIIAEEYTWADPIIGYFEEHVPDGMTIVYEVRFPSTTTSFLPYLTKAKDNEAELVMPLIALDWAITFHKEWAAIQYGLTAGIAVPSERSTYWEETEGEAKYHLELQGGLPKPNATEKSFNFYQDFYERHGEDAMYCAEWTYAGVYAYAEAVERAGTLESDAVIAELEKTHMATPYSILEFYPRTHSAKYEPDFHPDQFSQWMGPGYRPSVWTWTPNNRLLTDEPIAYADLTLPPWM